MTTDNMRKAGLPRLFALENEYLEVLMQAELDYVQTLIKEIEGGTLEGVEMWQHWFQGDAEGRPPPPQPEH
jgi:hypothetical protein